MVRLMTTKRALTMLAISPLRSACLGRANEPIRSGCFAFLSARNRGLLAHDSVGNLFSAKSSTSNPLPYLNTATEDPEPASPLTVMERITHSSTSRILNKQNTGGLRRLPAVKPPKELKDGAAKVPRSIKVDSTIANIRTRARKHGAETLNAVTQALCLPMRDVVKGYHSELRRLHPFEKVVADLTIQARQNKDGITLDQVLNEINEARKEILAAGKDWIAKAKMAETAREAGVAREEGAVALLELFDQLATEPLQQILELQRSLRTAPMVALDTPAVVLVGAPNVGKSSIVRTISSGTPEVNNYPFTTRAMTLGHVEVFWSNESEETEESSSDQTIFRHPQIVKAIVPQGSSSFRRRQQQPPSLSSSTSSFSFSQMCQIMDSPGLLVRDGDEDRNEMEKLTLASLQHLPTAVMFVLDLSGNAGDKCSSVSDQLLLRRQIRARFPKRPWIDVVSKFDLGIQAGALAELENILEGAPYLLLSIHDGTGLEELRHLVLRLLGEVQLVLDAMAGVDHRSARTTT